MLQGRARFGCGVLKARRIKGIAAKLPQERSCPLSLGSGELLGRASGGSWQSDVSAAGCAAFPSKLTTGGDFA